MKIESLYVEHQRRYARTHLPPDFARSVIEEARRNAGVAGLAVRLRLIAITGALCVMGAISMHWLQMQHTEQQNLQPGRRPPSKSGCSRNRYEGKRPGRTRYGRPVCSRTVRRSMDAAHAPGASAPLGRWESSARLSIRASCRRPYRGARHGSSAVPVLQGIRRLVRRRFASRWRY